MRRDTNNNLVPDFSTKSLGCFGAVFVVIIIASIPILSLLCKWKDLISCWIRPMSLTQMMQGVFPVLSVSVWPLFMLFVIYVFRDNLGAAVDAVVDIFRAWNGMDAIRVWNGEGEAVQCGSASTPLVLKSEANVLDILQRKLNRPIMREVQLFGMNFKFDGVCQDENQFVGIEVKTNCALTAIRERVHAISSEYARLRMRDKRRFSLLLYVPESLFEQCTHWRRDFDFKLSVVTVTDSGKMMFR